jgi:hypothetical protein
MHRSLCVSAAISALAALSISAYAQTPASDTPSMPSVPANTCVKPDFPGRLASSAKINSFNRDYAAYRDCTNKYIDSTKKLANDAVAAANAAVDDFNKFAAEIKAQNDANN